MLCDNLRRCAGCILLKLAIMHANDGLARSGEGFSFCLQGGGSDKLSMQERLTRFADSHMIAW
jgi:hypothetical protein